MRGMVFIAGAVALAACETDLVFPEGPEQVVVQAYLYAGEPVTDVRITSTLPLGSTRSVAPPITDAAVTLITGGRRFSLVPTAGQPGYYQYPDDDLVVAAGAVFDLEVVARGTTAAARTIVPPAPGGVTVSPSQLDVVGNWPREPAIVRWPNPERAWHFVTHQNVEDDPEPIISGTIIIRPGLIVSAPTVADSAVIPIFSMRHYGEYQIRVYRVNEEYARLYGSLRQDTRDLNEPASNIADGIGVFTAFNRVEAVLTVVR